MQSLSLSAKKWAVSNCSPLRHNWGTLEVLCKVLPGKIPQGWYFTYCFVIWALRASINTDAACSWVVQASRIAYLQEYRARKRIMTLIFAKCEISVRNLEIWNVLPRHPHNILSVTAGNTELQRSDHPAEAQLTNAMLAFKIRTLGSTPSVVRGTGGSST